MNFLIFLIFLLIYSTGITKTEFKMPAWPTLFPMYLHFKAEIPAPWMNFLDDNWQMKRKHKQFHPGTQQYVENAKKYDR